MHMVKEPGRIVFRLRDRSGDEKAGSRGLAALRVCFYNAA